MYSDIKTTITRTCINEVFTYKTTDEVLMCIDEITDNEVTHIDTHVSIKQLSCTEEAYIDEVLTFVPNYR